MTSPSSPTPHCARWHTPGTIAGAEGLPDAHALVSAGAVPDAHPVDQHGHGGVALALGALGIVFGDIGTSPLYAFREAFEHNDLEVTATERLGVASIVFWALIIIISIKYLALVMRADNHGEGGILALTALVMPEGEREPAATCARPGSPLPSSARRVRHRPALRRRADHPGDLGAQRRRGVRGRVVAPSRTG